QCGDITAARAAVREALVLGEGERFMRHFIDEGTYARKLLQMMKGDPLVPEHYLRQVLAGFETASPSPRIAPEQAGLPKPLEPLSGRENTVLALMAGGKSNRSIALELAITENTVKWHIKNIFQKLGVENRTSAVLAA